VCPSLGEAACVIAVRVVAVRDDLAAQRLAIGRVLVVDSLSLTRLQVSILSVKPGGACQWQINPRRATVRTNFHIATGLRIIHFSGGAT